jgi:hypothetical protein
MAIVLINEILSDEVLQRLYHVEAVIATGFDDGELTGARAEPLVSPIGDKVPADRNWSLPMQPSGQSPH